MRKGIVWGASLVLLVGVVWMSAAPSWGARPLQTFEPTPTPEVITSATISRLEPLATLTAYKPFIFDAEWSPDGSQLVLTGRFRGEYGIWLYDASDWSQPPRLLVEEEVGSIYYRPDGQVVAGEHHCAIAEWDVSTGRAVGWYVFPPDLGHDHCSFWGIDYSPDGSLIAMITVRGLRVWDTQTHDLVTVFSDKEIGMPRLGVFASGLTFSPDSQYLAFADPINDAFFVWFRATNTVSKAYSAGGWYEGVRGLSFDPNNSDRVAVGLKGLNGVALWNIPQHRWVTTLWYDPQRGNLTVDATFSPEGQLVAACGMNEGFIHFWKAASGHLVRTLEVDYEYGCSLRFNPAGTLLATKRKEEVVIWGVAAQE